MKRGNQMIKKLSVTIFSMMALTTLGLSSVSAQEQIDENVILDTIVITTQAPNEFTSTKHLIDENGTLDTATVTIESATPIVVSDEAYPFGV